MSKPTEERFPGYNSVSELEAYLKDMRKKIRKKIEKDKVEDPKKAKNFILLIEDVLGLSYFEMDINVFTLMFYLKEDSRRLETEIAKYKAQADEAKKAVEALQQEPEVDPSYAIPDEWKQQREAAQKKLCNAREDLYALESVIEDLMREKQLLHRLKGMICRPKGFFANL
ncbi:MAG: hypothetical protein J6B87_00735 [Clostridia bacterium]|nr:hypothetical protein [Clostridia bacterium]